MLTVILLVVLCGGVGLLAVTLADPEGLSGLRVWLERRSLRARGDSHTAREPEREPPPEPAPAPEPEPEPVAVHTPAPAPAPRAVRTDRSNRPDPATVPAAFVAVEGTYREVATPLWRRVVSLAVLVIVVIGLGVAVAALAGLVLGALAELLNGAVG